MWFLSIKAGSGCDALNCVVLLVGLSAAEMVISLHPLFAGYLFAAVVTLDSIEIYRTHEWFKAKPTVYFRCNGENKTVLPDVKEANVSYTFKGQESWQVRIVSIT